MNHFTGLSLTTIRDKPTTDTISTRAPAIAIGLLNRRDMFRRSRMDDVMSLEPSGEAPKFSMCFFGKSIANAVLNVIDSNQATAIPKATKTPKTCTGGMGVSMSEVNPTTVVTEVKSMGTKSSSMVSTTVFLMSLRFR